MLSNYSFPKTLNKDCIDLDILGEIRPNTEYALYITCDPATLTNACWCGFITPYGEWGSNSVYYGDNTRYFVLKTNENIPNNSKFRLRGDKGVTINHIRLIELVTNSKYSRIERFLYALYSLDSSDLPTPLSRIEELYKCLVTGEEPPTFEPLSRVEKYLMAILGVYDVDSLPNPLSRVEALLYKLATGDDNLDDVKSFLSEHEELLAEIIRNGGVGGNVDIEYVLYTLSTEFNTLYNTAEKPIKSAILKGKTDENLQSVKMPVLTTVGKNLWCGDKDVFIANGIEHFNMSFKKGTYYFTGDVDTVYPDGPTTIAFSNTFTGYGVGVYINNSKSSATLKEDCNQVKIYTNGWSFVNSTNKPQTIKNLMLSNTYPISYEPYKSNILTVNEDVTLRGIGDVQDTLDCLTGELTERIGEVVIDETWGWHKNNENETTICYYSLSPQVVTPNIAVSPAVISNKLPVVGNKSETAGIATAKTQNRLYVVLPKGIEPKLYFADNPISVQYQLATESVKTVDLSVVDQDGNDTKLSTFNDITHVTLSSEGLIPEAELEVATKNEEVLNTMSLEMDDISTTQNDLQETSNTQSENVDATMMATTEIYEQIL